MITSEVFVLLGGRWQLNEHSRSQAKTNSIRTDLFSALINVLDFEFMQQLFSHTHKLKRILTADPGFGTSVFSQRGRRRRPSSSAEDNNERQE